MSVIDTLKFWGCTRWYNLYQSTQKNRIDNASATVQGTISPRRISTGQFAGWFDGSTYLIGSNCSLPGQTFAIGLSFMQTETAQPGSYACLYSSVSADETDYVKISISDANVLTFVCANGSTVITCTYSDAAIVNGQWYHVIVTHNTTACSLYVNGLSMSNQGAVSLDTANFVNHSVGTFGGTDAAFVGCMKDFTMFNTILSTARMKKLASLFYTE